jgi:2-keto-4-pentenoate hydratase/2-oxohepta-3-ene-1,7-dioic acid hydratase in catechol pathway
MITGTPSGIAALRKIHAWLKDGNVVELEIGKIGRRRNTMVIGK